jgi:hypothetical protein
MDGLVRITVRREKRGIESARARTQKHDTFFLARLQKSWNEN